MVGDGVGANSLDACRYWGVMDEVLIFLADSDIYY